MMKFTVIFLIGAGLLFGAVGLVDARVRKREPQKTLVEQQPDSAKTAPRKRNTAYPRLFRNKRVTTEKGVITLHKVNDKLYFEFPVALIGHDFLISSSVAATNDNSGGWVGQVMHQPLHIRFALQGEEVYMQNVTPASRTDMYSSQADISSAIARSNIAPDMDAFKILAYNMDSTAVVFDMTKYFFSDNKRLPLFDPDSPSLKDEKLGTLEMKTTLKKNLSFITGFHAFDDNVEVSLDMSFYKSLMANKREVRGGTVRVKAVYSLLLLPNTVMEWRLADPRLGYTYSEKLNISTQERDATSPTYLQHKWNLLPADEAAYRRGDLTAPLRPITFYIDSDFPESWKAAIKKGVMWWNEAFRMAGFKDAVRAVDFPENDTAFYAGNLKYSCIRYVPGHFANLRSTVWVDPRSGEIVNGSIFIGQDVVRTIAEQRFVQTAQVDPQVRHVRLPENLLLESLTLYTAHEVGHCLGLSDNASASAVFSVSALQSAAWTAEHGLAASVMDELPCNYLLRPQDTAGLKVQDRLGEYDRFAIQMGYMLVSDAHTPEAVRQQINRWVTRQSGQPLYRYGKAQLVGAEYDPSALSGDLSSQPVLAGKAGIAHLKYILQHIDGWVNQEDSDYQFRISIYPKLVERYRDYLWYAWRNVGGFYLTEHEVGDQNIPKAVVPKSLQREAARFVMDELCRMKWIDDARVMRNMPVQTPVYQKLVKEFAGTLVNTRRISLAYYRDKQSYSPEEYLDDVYKGVWASTLQGRSLNRAEMLLQYEVVAALLKKLQLPNHTETTGREKRKGQKPETLLRAEEVTAGFGPLGYVTNLSDDNQAHLCHGLLVRIQKLMEARLHTGNDETRMHYGQLLEKIEDIRNW